MTDEEVVEYVPRWYRGGRVRDTDGFGADARDGEETWN
jgi:hypothetical protein